MFVESHDAELRELDSIWAKGALLICVWGTHLRFRKFRKIGLIH